MIENIAPPDYGLGSPSPYPLPSRKREIWKGDVMVGWLAMTDKV
jgi:hypothetical protein